MSEIRDIAPALAERVRGSVAQALAEEEREAPRARLRTIAAGAVAVALAGAMLIWRMGIQPGAGLSDLIPAAAFVALWIGGMAVVAARPSIARARAARWLLAAAAGAFALAVVLAAGERPVLQPEGVFVRAAAGCFAGVLQVGLAGLGMIVLARGRAPNRLLGMAAGATAGLLGAAVLQLHCAVGGGGHLLVGHGLALAGAALAGAAWLKPAH